MEEEGMVTTLLGGGIKSALKASSKIFNLLALKEVYLMNQGPRLSLCLSP